MKKLVSMLIVAVMVFATFAVAIPTAAFTGVEEVEALYFDTKPTIDGIVSEEEWGLTSVIVEQKDAATVEDTSPKNNRFFLRNDAAVPGFDTENLSMYYELWLRWDENYYYVAARVKDPDGHSLKNGRNNTWNGDGFQVKIDPEGYNASAALGPEWYDPAPSEDGAPWSTSAVDFTFGFVESAGGFAEAWNQTTNTGITPFLGGTCDISVVPAGAVYSTDSGAGYTTYEIAIPWSYIDSRSHGYANYKTDSEGAIGRSYGVSAVIYNADGTSGANKWNAGLGWGSGIINVQQNEHYDTCAGSNNVILSGDKVSEDDCYDANYTRGGGYVPPETTYIYPTEIDTSRLVGPLTYDSESDLDKFGLLVDGVRVQDTDGNWVVQWNEDTGDLSLSPSDLGLNEYNYLSSRGEEPGTYLFDGKGNYTMEFDVKITDLQGFADGYGHEIYNWFGGAKTVEYMCGYSFDDKCFFIKEFESGKILATYPYEWKLGEWHHWVFQYFKDNSEMRFYFDPVMYDGHVSENAKATFIMKYRYFDMPGVESNEVILRRMNCQIMLDNVKYYNFVKFTDEIPDDNHGTVIVPVQQVSDADLNVIKNDDGTFAVEILNNKNYLADNVTALKFTLDLTKAEGKLIYKGVAGLAEGDFEAKENEDGTVTITIKNLKALKDIKEGDPIVTITLAPEADVELDAKGVKDIISVKATVTSTSAATGDTVVLYAAAALLLLASIATGVVLYTKKRRHIDF